MKNIENIRTRKVEVKVKDKMISYEEYYVVNEEGEEVFNREIEIENDQRLYDIYKKQSNLLTNAEIKKIRKKYGLNQKDYAAIIGVGEVTVHRFEKGAIQTEAVDSIMRLSNNPDNMKFLLSKNKKNINNKLLDSLLIKVNDLQKLKKHQIIDLSKFDEENLIMIESTAKDISKNIIKIYNDKIDSIAKEYEISSEYITNLKLQKLLYYVQSISLLVFGKRAFSEKIMAWSYGPVVSEIYQEYKGNHNKEIKVEGNIKELSSGLKKIIEEVIDGYGVMEATKLIDFTHEEDPWKTTKTNQEITIEKIINYFNKVYDIY